MDHWMSVWWIRLVMGAIGSLIIVYPAYRVRSLSLSGAWSAFVMGSCYVTLGDPMWFGVLLAFFISSSGWSKWKRRHKAKQKAEGFYAKTGGRDPLQVWANGGLGLILCAGYACWPAAGWMYAFVGTMGAVNADTWATEIGAISRAMPRALLSGRVVAPGTSGGVTLLGSAAAFAGATFIGVVAALLLSSASASPGGLIITAAAAGFLGAFADSLLGATVQAMYRCGVCGSMMERKEHCGVAAVKIRGWAGMTNDAVNLASSAFAGLVACAIGSFFYG